MAAGAPGILGAAVALAGPAPPVAAASWPGSRPSGTASPAATARCGAYRPPVDATVIDGFRLPAGEYGPGNRGLEYATTPGTSVRAVGAGVVTFAGPVGGRLAVSVRHADGRVSSLTGLTVVRVAVGELVARGQSLGVAGSRTHLGIREDGRYVDPAPVLCHGRRRAVLVPGPP